MRMVVQHLRDFNFRTNQIQFCESIRSEKTNISCYQNSLPIGVNDRVDIFLKSFVIYSRKNLYETLHGYFEFCCAFRQAFFDEQKVSAAHMSKLNCHRSCLWDVFL